MDADQGTATESATEEPTGTDEATNETEQTPDTDTLGDAGKKALAEERTARKEAQKELAALKDEVSRLRRSNAANKGTDLEALRAEFKAEFAGQMAETKLQAEAKGRLVNAADVTLYLSASDFAGKDDADITAAVDKLLEERPYLAAQKNDAPHWGDVGGGKRDQGEPEPRNAVDRMARAYGRSK